MNSPEREIKTHLSVVKISEEVSYRPIYATWFYEADEEVPQLPSEILARACSHGASRSAIGMNQKEEILSELTRLGVSQDTAQTILKDLPENAGVSIFGFMIGSTSYIAVLEKEVQTPQLGVPYKIRLAKCST